MQSKEQDTLSKPSVVCDQKPQEMPCPSLDFSIRACKELTFPFLPHQKHEIEFSLSGQGNVLNMSFPAGECLPIGFFPGFPLVTKKPHCNFCYFQIYVMNRKVKPEFPFLSFAGMLPKLELSLANSCVLPKLHI